MMPGIGWRLTIKSVPNCKENVMKAWKHSASPWLILLFFVGGIGWLLSETSSSQENKTEIGTSEVGRYQYVAGQIFDTKTARLWVLLDTIEKDGQQKTMWVRQDAPWESNQKVKSGQLKGARPKGQEAYLGEPAGGRE
jgi:hypothetical protein